MSYAQLSRRVGGLGGRALLRFGVRMAVVVGVTVLVAFLAREAIGELVDGESRLEQLLRLAVVGVVGGAGYLTLARAFRITEVTEVLGSLTGRFQKHR